jgi:hypothetical protein
MTDQRETKRARISKDLDTKSLEAIAATYGPHFNQSLQRNKFAY